MTEELDSFTTMRNERLLADFDLINSGLNDPRNENVATLQERIFVNVFLPLFAGDAELLYDVNLLTWANYAGGPYREVKIIDNKGTVLFKVPALFDRSGINPISDGMAPVAHMVATAGQYANMHPVVGMKYLNDELDKRALVMKVPASLLKNLEEWNAIFKRYGRPEIMELPTEAKVQSDSTPGATIDYDFEPL